MRGLGSSLGVTSNMVSVCRFLSFSWKVLHREFRFSSFRKNQHFQSPNSVVAEQRLTAVKVSSQPEYFLCTMSVWSYRCSHLTVRSLKYSLWLLNSFLQIPTHAQYLFCPWSVLMHWNLNGGKPKRLRVMLFRTTLTCTIMLDMLMKWLPRSNLSVNIHVCMLLSSSSDPDPRTIFIIICIMLNVTFPRLEIQSLFNNRDR